MVRSEPRSRLDPELEALLLDLHGATDRAQVSTGYRLALTMRNRHAAGDITDAERAALSWNGNTYNGVHVAAFDELFDLMNAMANPDPTELLDVVFSGLNCSTNWLPPMAVVCASACSHTFISVTTACASCLMSAKHICP